MTAAGVTTDGIDRRDAANRVPITIAIMLSTLMSSVDSTIANVALPHIQGAISASADQITWVLTSYIVAAAIMTPLSGFLADRVGRKRVLLTSVIGFTVVSMLCGIADSLPELVAFRLLQGVFGAALVPVSQAVLLDINPPERIGPAMAMWSAASLVGPIIGPVLGGWLTENLTWRWVFYINLPIGIMASASLYYFLSEKRAAKRVRFDMLGFGSLAVAIGALQLMLDRGPAQDWFGSTEIWIYLAVGVMSTWVFIVQIFTAKAPFISRELFTDVNFVSATILGFLLGMMLFCTLALIPPMMQNLMGYPVSFAGIVSTPRGFGSILAMFVGGQLIGRVPIKVMLWSGLVICLWSSWLLTQMNLLMDTRLFIMNGFFQGIGTGLLFVPLATVAFATVRPELRGQGAGLFTLIRNMGSAAGIAMMQAQVVRGTDVHHAQLVEHARPDNPIYQAYLSAPYGFGSPQALAALDAMIRRQATMLSYVDVFHLLLGLTCLWAPLILIMRTRRARPEPGPHVVVE